MAIIKKTHNYNKSIFLLDISFKYFHHACLQKLLQTFFHGSAYFFYFFWLPINCPINNKSFSRIYWHGKIWQWHWIGISAMFKRNAVPTKSLKMLSKTCDLHDFLIETHMCDNQLSRQAHLARLHSLPINLATNSKRSLWWISNIVSFQKDIRRQMRFHLLWMCSFVALPERRMRRLSELKRWH